MSVDLIAILVTAFTVLCVQWLGYQKIPWVRKLLDWFPSILFAYLIPAVFTHSTGLDLSTVFLHQLSKDWIIPLAIVSVMSALSFKQLRIIGAKPILLFVSGSAVIATLPVILVMFSGSSYGMFIEQEYWKGLVPIVGGWIGGSTSQLVLKELAECPEGLFLSVLVLDNILVNIWTILMFQMIKRSDQLNKWLKIDDQIQPYIAPPKNPANSGARVVWFTMGLILIVTLITNTLVSSFLWRVIILSLLGLALGNLLPIWHHTFVLKLGGILIILIMAILGLKLNFSTVSLPLNFAILVVILLLLHYLFMMVAARLLNVHMAWVPIGSMANLGGISTAPAVTAAYNPEWMPHAILLAILSMVTGTAWGMLTIFLFGLL